MLTRPSPGAALPLVLTAAISLHANPAAAQEGQDPLWATETRQEVVALAEAWIQGWNEGDLESMTQLHDEDLIYYWRGQPRRYDTFIDELRDYIFPNETFSVRLVDLRVQLLDTSTAVVGFQMGDSRDLAIEPGAAVSLVLFRRPSGWRVVHIHESPVRD